MPEGESSEGYITRRPAQTVEDAILGEMEPGIDIFTGVPDDSETSANTYLNRRQMTNLREKIEEVRGGFNDLIRGSIFPVDKLELAKVMYIYNHILSTVSYADVELTRTGHVSPFDVLSRGHSTASSYSALVTQSSVCRGISEAVYLLCKSMKVNAEIRSQERPPHAFNRVNIGGVWYKLDATYEIGLTPGAKKDRWSSNYFLKAWGNTSTDYPREQIASMKNFLSDKGLRFEGYPEKPKIQIKPPKIDIRGRSDKRPRIEVRTRGDT